VRQIDDGSTGRSYSPQSLGVLYTITVHETLQGTPLTEQATSVGLMGLLNLGRGIGDATAAEDANAIKVTTI
jgi:hypothetical protein